MTRALRWVLGACAVLVATVALAADPLPSVVIKALGTSSRKAEVALLEDAAATTTDPTLLPWILLYAGEARRLNDEPGLARSHFERVAGDFPSHRARNPAILGMAVIDAGRAPSGNTRATLELIGEDNVPDTMNADRFLLLARARAGERAPADEIAALVAKATQYAHGDRDVSRRITREADSLGAGAQTTAAPPNPAAPGDQGAIQEIRAALAAGRMADAQRLAEAFPGRHPDSPFVREAAYALRRATSGKAPVPGRVAVLLPLTGEYAQPGASLKAAIELANDRSPAHAELRFYDTGDKADGCPAILEKAVLTDGAVLAIGPLQREMALACAPTAQALRVPLLTLTSSVEPLAAGDQVFHAFPSPEGQIAALLGEARDGRGITRFAILHPNTSYGENAAAAFTAFAAQHGASVVRTRSYATDTKDFREVAKLIAGGTGVTPDFDALFIPDAYPRVALIASALAYQEIAVGAFRPDHDRVPIVLLGLNAWHNDELAVRGGKYVQDCLFVDAFDPRAADPATAAFVDAWTARGEGPPGVVEAVGYDTMLLAGTALAAGGADLAATLAAVQPKGTVTGVVGFDASRDARRDWRLFTVTREGVVALGAEPAQP